MSSHPNAPGNLDDDLHGTATGTSLVETGAFAEQTLAVDLAQIEINQMIATAHRFPRRIETALKKLESMVLYNEAAAENSIYALPRGGKPILGPSIGFADALATAWGNCWDYSQHLGIDRREKIVLARGVFVDWESNRTLKRETTRRISDKNGRLFNDDMIVITSQAAQQIARRNAILSAIPRSIWFPVYEKAVFVVKGSEQTLPEKREKAIRALAQFGIDPTKIFLFLQVKKMEDIGVEHLPTLRAMYTQLRDGTVTPEEMFDPRRMTGGTFEQLNNPLGEEEEEPEDTGRRQTVERTGGSGMEPDPQTHPGENPATGRSTTNNGGSGGAAGGGSGAYIGGGGAAPRNDADAGTTTAGSGGGSTASPEASTAGTARAEPADTGKKTRKTREKNAPAAASTGTPQVEAIAGTAPLGASPAAPAAAQDAEEVFPQPYITQTPEAYFDYAMRWLAQEKVSASARDRWQKERTIRNGLKDKLSEDQLAKLQVAMGKVGQ